MLSIDDSLRRPYKFRLVKVFAESTFDLGNNMEVEARYYFATAGGGVAEDPGTGSACANLGGWFIHKQRSFPFKAIINQGLAVKRPCKLLLEVTADRQIRVAGRVLEFARGVVEI
jgi:trans-2,3-dihydro-3-hydroxyanthranilate isomerase